MPAASSASEKESDVGQKLEAGETFPSVTMKLVGGETVTLPDDLATPYGVVLFYRGHW